MAVKPFPYAAKTAGSAADAWVGRRRRMRLWLLLGAGLLWSAALGARLFSLQISDFSLWQDWALKQHFATVTVAAERGPIYDRDGHILAVSVPSGSVYVRPAKILDRGAVSRALADLLGMPEAQIHSKLISRQPFVWVKRQIPKVIAEKVAALQLPGVDYLIEARRYYPYNEIAGPLVGKVGIDGNGLSGVEMAYDRRLKAPEHNRRMIRDALGNSIQDPLGNEENFDLPKGSALTLTIDASLQGILSGELEEGRSHANAKAAMGVIIDADSGDILAMAQAPALNFNFANVTSKSDLHNLVVETVFEPGSIMKPVVAAAAIELGLMSPSDIINCEGGRFRFGRHTIKDVHPYYLLSLSDVVVRSSNIGMTKVGMRLGSKRLYQSLKAFGFGAGLQLSLPGETSGILRDCRNWAAVDVATHAFGQGVAVTPLQMARAVSVIANGGKLPSLRLVAEGPAAAPVPVISPETAAKVQKMMVRVVEDEHGTGKRAAIEGVIVGGKTGTAQKTKEGARGYAGGLYSASFVGFVDGQSLGVPLNLVSIIVIDEPRTSSIYGGTLAAPVFKRVMQRSLHLLSTSHKIRTPNFADRGADPRAEGFVLASYQESGGE